MWSTNSITCYISFFKQVSISDPMGGVTVGYSYRLSLLLILAKIRSSLTCHLHPRRQSLNDRRYRIGRGLTNSLTAIGGPDRQLFFELRARVVSPQIFVRSQSLIAR